MNIVEKIPDGKTEELAKKYNLDLSVINDLLQELTTYENVLHDSFEGFKKLPFKKRDNLPWSVDTEGWVKLSLWYHNNQREIETTNPKIFTNGLFKAKRISDDLELSEFIVNDMLKVYLEKMAKENLLLDKQKSESLRDFYKRKGKRGRDENAKRDNMIRLAASYLIRNKVQAYTAFIIELFQLLGYGNLSKGNIRYIKSQ